MRAVHLQFVLALVFAVLGGWCVLMPTQVEGLVLNPDYQEFTTTSRLLFQCFGAQAMLVATVLAFSRLSARGFLVFGLAGSLPFFIFNYYFLYVVPMFTNWMILDFAGNIIILVTGLTGWRLRLRENESLGRSQWQDLY